MNTPPEERLSRGLRVALMAIFATVLLRTAWLCDDAYITFRVVDNFVQGYGLRWNVAERVQVFTHPLWMLAISAFHFVTREVYFTALGVSAGISLAAVYLATFRVAASAGLGMIGLAVLVSSRAFVDYSTSGLENPLSHLLLVWFVVELSRRRNGPRGLFMLGFIAGVAALNRMDTILLYLPVLGWEILRTRRLGAALAAIAGFWPLAIWMLFSTFYYGFPFPNTAFAKLSTGIDPGTLMHQGARYLENSLRWDPITLIAIGVGLASGFAARSARRAARASGILLYLLYIVSVGGDFMSGRFLTVPLFSAVLLIVDPKPIWRPLWNHALVAAALIAGLLGPSPTLLSGSDHGLRQIGSAIDRYGIAAERAYYFPRAGLLNGRWEPKPLGDDAIRGRLARERKDPLAVEGAIGYFGFLAGPGVHVVDYHALADPLLARLPAVRSDPTYERFYRIFWNHAPPTPWRIGHFRRNIPRGYLALQLGYGGRFEDPLVERYAHKLFTLTRGPLWEADRAREIIAFGLGRYDGWVDPSSPPYLEPIPWDEVIALRPDFAKAYYYRAGDGRATESNYVESDLETTLRLNPHDADAAVMLGKILDARGESRRALGLYRRAVDSNPTYPVARVSYALAVRLEGDATVVSKEGRRAVELDPNNPGGYLAIGVGHGMEGRYEDAIESFRLAVRIAPSYPEAYYNLAVAYGLTDQRDEALENLEIAADLGYAPAREALASVNSAQP